jgi:hypothetical protein
MQYYAYPADARSDLLEQLCSAPASISAMWDASEQVCGAS